MRKLRFSNLLEVLQLVSSEAGIQTWISGSHSLLSTSCLPGQAFWGKGTNYTAGRRRGRAWRGKGEVCEIRSGCWTSTPRPLKSGRICLLPVVDQFCFQKHKHPPERPGVLPRPARLKQIRDEVSWPTLGLIAQTCSWGRAQRQTCSFLWEKVVHWGSVSMGQLQPLPASSWELEGALIRPWLSH